MRTFKGTFRIPTEEDVRQVAEHMRMADRRELKRWTGQEPGYELKHSIDCSDVCYAGVFEDGRVACIFGACRVNLLDNTATIWSLSSTEVDRHPIEFYLGSKAGLDLIFREMSDVQFFANFVDLEYESAVNWLERLGFDMSLEAKRAGLRGGVFGQLYTINPYYKEA